MATDLTIKSLITELNSLKTEIKTRREALKKLTEREKEIHTKIKLFLKEKNQPGVKDKTQGIAIVSEKVEKTVRKKKNEAKQDILNVLRHYMDDNKAQKIFNEMEESNKGEKIEKEVLKIMKL